MSQHRKRHHDKPSRHHDHRDHRDLAVVPSDLVRLSQTITAEDQHVDDAWRAAEPGLQLDRGVAGDAAAGPRLIDAHAVCAESAASAIGFLREVLDNDMDTLLRVAFDFSGTDEAAATAFNQRAVQVGATPTPTPIQGP